MNQSARDAILGRIDEALHKAGPGAPGSCELAWQSLPRLYEQSAPLSSEDALALLEERLRDYDAEVVRTGEEGVASALEAMLTPRENQPVLVPQGFPERWKPCTFPLVVDDDLSTRQLDGFDCVLTSATLAIAETGTLVLQNVSGQGRRALTLIPDIHICVVRASDVVGNVPEAFARLAGSATLPTTFVSGPSATADIEMTRIKGVHGPRFLHVLLVRNDAPAEEFASTQK